LKSIAMKLTLILTTIFFTACSNMQVGFEEDSPFYSPPSEKKETPLVAETKEQTTVVKEQQKPQETSVKTESKVEETVQVKTVETVKEEEEEEAPVVEKEAEGETTFSYSREDGE
jgi:D-alanyl-D-alanine carboxypeptidase